MRLASVMVDLKVKTLLVALFHAFSFLAHTAAAQNGRASRLMLWTRTDRRMNANLLRAIRAEVANLVVPGFSGVDVHMDAEGKITTSEYVVAVHLTGECNTYADRRWRTPGPLGYVTLSNGAISPNMSVSCDDILSAIKPALHDVPLVRRNALYAQAIIRVVRHELRHILEQTAEHLNSGLFKPRLNPTDLLSPDLLAQGFAAR